MMRDRYGLDFEDDGASFRVRRQYYLDGPARFKRQMTPAERLIRQMLCLIAPFALAFLLALLWAIGTGVFESLTRR